MSAKDKTEYIFQSDLCMPHDYVKNSVEFEYGHHRTEWMESKLFNLNNFFSNIFSPDMIPLVLTNTEKGSLEAVITNLHYKYNVIYTTQKSSWSEVMDSIDVQYETLKTDSLGEFADGHNLLLLDDTTTHIDSFEWLETVDELAPSCTKIINASNTFASDMRDWSKLPIDGCVLAPEKSLGGIRGMSILVLKEEILQSVETDDLYKQQTPYTFDLKKYYESWKKKDTPYSPDISSLVALNASIEIINNNGGLDSHIERQSAVASTIKNIFSNAPFSCSKSSVRKTEVVLPEERSAKSCFEWLKDNKNIYIDGYNENTNSITIGHVGHISKEQISYLQDSIYEKCNLENRSPKIELEEIEPPSCFLDNDPDFEVSRGEFMRQAELKAESAKDNVSKQKIISSAEYFFKADYPKESFVFKNRIVGFIGAGNTVKETVKRCKKIGIENIMVFSPSLAKSLKSDKADENIKYWTDQGITVCQDTDEVFLKCHTVVLLPTYYDETGAKIRGKEPLYINKEQINDALLCKIRDEGKMDLLINASARTEIINRAALNKHLNLGWLRFVSDETPSEDDPVTNNLNTLMTGHIGGSSDLTKERIAINTGKILEHLITELLGVANQKTDGYKLNFLNNHLAPETGWRSTEKPLHLPDSRNIKVLMTDIFDVQKIGFDRISKKHSVEFEIIDASNEASDEKALIELIQRHNPNILMIRTKTVITDAVAAELAKVEDFYYLIRPGVGVENIYPGMKTLSENGIRILNEPYGNSFSVGEMTARFLSRAVPITILTPGPTPYNNLVFSAIRNYTSYKSEKFSVDYKYLLEGVSNWMNLPNGPVVTSSPSTGLMESAVTNLTSKGDNGLVVAHGKFGNRFIDICEQNDRTAYSLRVEDKKWGEAFSSEDIKNKIVEIESKNQKLSFICFQQNETSSGIAYKQKQLEQIVKILRNHNNDIIIILDVVSGLFAHRLDFSTIDVDMTITGSQKGLGVTSGISYAMLSDRALSKIAEISEHNGSWDELISDEVQFLRALKTFENKQKVRYFSLPRLLYNNHKAVSDNIPSIFHVISTSNSLRLLNANGKDAVAKHSQELANMCIEAAKKLNIELLVDEEYRSSTVTPLLLPENISAPEFKKQLENEFGLLVSGAQNEALKPRLLRIGHTGYVDIADTVKLIRSLNILFHERNN